MSQSQISYIDIRFVAHATEDINKVIEAVHNILPPDYLDDILFKSSRVDGHYGNPITFFETRIKNEKITKAFIENISSKLGLFDKEELKRELDRCIDKGSLYIRIDKQAAFQKKVKLTVPDPIRIRIRFRKSKKEDITEICRKVGIIS